MTLADASGDEDYDRLRPLSYVDGDLVLLAFAMDDPRSVRSVSKRWMPEITHLLPKESFTFKGIIDGSGSNFNPLQVPIILVGTKSDLKSQLEQKSLDGCESESRYVDIRIIKCPKGIMSI